MTTDANTAAKVIPLWTLPDRIRKAREHAGLSQAELADRLSVTRASVVNWERGHTKPLRIILYALADEAGIERTWLEGAEEWTADSSDQARPVADDYGPPSDVTNPDIPSGMPVDHSPSRAEILAHRKSFKLKFGVDAQQAVAS